MRFERTGKDAVYRIINSLESRGWLVRVGGGTRNKIGRDDPTSYRVVTHEDWIKVEGHACLELSTGTSLENETGSNPSTSLDSTPTSLDSTNHLSRFCLPPVEKSRHSSEKASEKTSIVASVENQPQGRALLFSNSKPESQDQPQPQHPPSEGKRQEPAEGEGEGDSPIVGELAGENHPRGKSEDSEAEFQKSLSKKSVTRIWHLYPGNERLQDQALSLSQAMMIFGAARRDGLKVLNATRAFAAAVKEWLAEEQKRIPPWEQWYSASEYLKDPAEWAPAQGGDSATAGCSSLRGLGAQ